MREVEERGFVSKKELTKIATCNHTPIKKKKKKRRLVCVSFLSLYSSLPQSGEPLSPTDLAFHLRDIVSVFPKSQTENILIYKKGIYSLK